MDVCIYKTRGKNGYIYDMSLNPLVDFEILKNTRNINNIEVITPYIPIGYAEEILKSIYYKPSIIGRLMRTGDLYINTKLKKLKIKRISKLIVDRYTLPSNDEVSRLERYITGRVVTFRRLKEIKENIGIKSELIDIIQTLYCERRIKVVPAVRHIKNKDICSFCNRECCDDCNLGFTSDDIILYAADNYNIKLEKKVYSKCKNMKDELKDIAASIQKFIDSKKSSLFFWCVPHSFQYDVLIPSIVETINNGGRILYVTSSLRTYEVIQNLKEKISDIAIGNTNRYDINLIDLDVSVCSYNEYPCFYKAFDLVILDERDFFIQRPVKNISYICKRAAKERGKYIRVTYNPEIKKGIRMNTEIITFPVSYSRKPIPEPRIIESRFLKDDQVFIPEMALEIIRWSIGQGSRVVIFTPRDMDKDRIYYYLTEIERLDSYSIDISDEEDKASIMRFKKGELDIIISSDFKDAVHIVKDINVVVMYGDNEKYHIDTLINICAMASFHSGKNTGEAVVVCSNENDTISNAKSVIRSINKVAWEKNHVNI